MVAMGEEGYLGVARRGGREGGRKGGREQDE